MKKIAAAVAVLAIAVGVAGARAQETRTVPYVVVAEFPHDPEAFTQGLAFGRGFFEGTGLKGESSLRKVRLTTGEVLRRVDLDAEFFGEGITVYKGRIYQITWEDGVAFVYDRDTFERVRKFTYRGEGWGLADNARRLIMSDGTNIIRFRRPGNFRVVRRIEVTDDGEPVHDLNELEWVEGKIYANVWHDDRIAIINPRNGNVTGWIDLGPLKKREEAEGSPDVTNGIAYKERGERLFVTGKEWAHIYEIELQH